MDFPLPRGGYILGKEIRKPPWGWQGKGQQEEAIIEAVPDAPTDISHWPARALLIPQPSSRESQGC